MPRQRLSGLSAAEVATLAADPSNVVMQPTYDVVFTPWPRHRLEAALRRLADIARRSASKEEAQRTASEVAELREFARCYQLMYERVSDPAIAANEGHMKILTYMIDEHDRMERGEVGEAQARANVSDFALAGLLGQVQGRDGGSGGGAP